MRKLALVVLSCTLTAPAFAESYCLGASKEAGSMLLTNEAAAVLRAKCRPGDIVYIPTNEFNLIGSVTARARGGSAG